MPMLLIPANVTPRQIDDFPPGCARSQKGAIYVRPASTLELTEAEWKHLQLRHHDVARCFIVVGQKPTLKRRLEPRLQKDAALKKKLDEAEGKVVPKEKVLPSSSQGASKKKNADKE